MHVAISLRTATWRIDARAQRRRAHVLRSRAWVCGFGLRAETCEPFASAVHRVLLGAQAFYSASAFNANIGAWNTASVASLSYVCAAL